MPTKRSRVHPKYSDLAIETALTGSAGAVRLIDSESRRLRHEMRAGGSTIFGCAFT